MKPIASLLLCFGTILSLQAQTSLKNLAGTPYVKPQPLQIAQPWHSGIAPARVASGLSQNRIHSILPAGESIDKFKVMPSGNFWIDLKPNTLWQTRASLSEVMQKIVPSASQKMPIVVEWKARSEHSDKNQVSHIRVQQYVAGVPIRGQEMMLHISNGELLSLNGCAWTASLPQKLIDPVPAADAIHAAREFLHAKEVSFHAPTDLVGIHSVADEAEKIWFPLEGKLYLAYKVSMHPNPMDHWTVYVDAGSLDILESISETCSFAPLQLFTHVPVISHNEMALTFEATPSPTVLLDGATTTMDQDLFGLNRTVNGYQVGSTFFMIDASRSTMYKPAQSVMPNDPVGVIWTVDAQNSSPQQSNFEVVHVTNTNNNWKNLEVSAHYNAGQAFEYYRTTFNRNSINGSGGNIISIINVTDANDADMDNAFWNGAAMFYGNGNVAFTSLAKGLDVAGHEMSHGVIQNTANLEYVGQSGALNESYADVFGAMIDRDDWKIGEDVVKLNFFPSGALRDLSNPNNGGNGPGDNGWQPKHMNEYQNLPNTSEGDNGGVHVNSGIPNRAFFLFANAIGKNKAEQVYYKALTDYLVKSSQFIDMRIAVEKAATDLHGANSAEVMAARSAFDQVGIGSGQGGDYEEDIEVNDGDDFILATDDNESDLYWVPPSNPNQFVKMQVPAPLSRPSFTDDGTACVYVDKNKRMIVISFDWSLGLDFQWDFVETNPQTIWRNIVVSKDGSKIAYTTSNLRNEISVYDFDSGGEEVFTLYNPTSAGGISSEDILYPDAMEWDYSGEYIMYDALNRINSGFGNGIEYWDISFLRAWNRSGHQFGSGLIGKLFSALPENISIGNPSFAKNSPYIITFDFVEDYYDIFGFPQTDYWVIAANIESGSANNIYHNTTVGYPSYSRLDDKILFTYYDDNNESNLLATIDVQPTDKTLPVDNTDVIVITGAQKGVWFVTGNRVLTPTEEIPSIPSISVWPQPAADVLQVSHEGIAPQAEYSITDISGKLVKTGYLDHHTLPVSDLTPGIYVLEFGADTPQPVTSRFIKQ